MSDPWYAFENEPRFLMENALDPKIAEHDSSGIALTPKLVTWALQLTSEGAALAAWSEAQGKPLIETIPSGSLLNPAAAWLRQHQDEAVTLWQQYAAELAGAS